MIDDSSDADAKEDEASTSKKGRSSPGRSPTPTKRRNGKAHLVSSPHTEAALKAYQQLYTVLIPQVAVKLDDLLAMPLDSYGVTQYLHRQGLNCRHMGGLFSLCKNPSSRYILLSEIVARSCKTILFQSLRYFTRKGKGMSIQAEYRGRSKEIDFRTHQDQIITDRAQVVLDFFNLVLGHGSETADFWKGTPLTMSHLSRSRFGTNLSFVSSS